MCNEYHCVDTEARVHSRKEEPGMGMGGEGNSHSHRSHLLSQLPSGPRKPAARSWLTHLDKGMSKKMDVGICVPRAAATGSPRPQET